LILSIGLPELDQNITTVLCLQTTKRFGVWHEQVGYNC
jgi:hypothetical protein